VRNAGERGVRVVLLSNAEELNRGVKEMLFVATRWHHELWNKKYVAFYRRTIQQIKTPAETGGHLFEETHYFCGLLCPPCCPP
jgi:hypothetical protein